MLLVKEHIYGALIENHTIFLAEFASERFFGGSGLSKSIAAGVRRGWVSCPTHFRHSIRVAQKMFTGCIPFLLVKLCAQFGTFTLRQSAHARFLRSTRASTPFVLR